MTRTGTRPDVLAEDVAAITTVTMFAGLRRLGEVPGSDLSRALVVLRNVAIAVESEVLRRSVDDPQRAELRAWLPALDAEAARRDPLSGSQTAATGPGVDADTSDGGSGAHGSPGGASVPAWALADSAANPYALAEDAMLHPHRYREIPAGHTITAEPPFPTTAVQPAATWHVGRAWSGHDIEDECPCPQELCGLVDTSRADPDCDQHPPTRARSLRQGHRSDQCPARAGTLENAATAAEEADRG